MRDVLLGVLALLKNDVHGDGSVVLVPTQVAALTDWATQALLDDGLDPRAFFFEVPEVGVLVFRARADIPQFFLEQIALTFGKSRLRDVLLLVLPDGVDFDALSEKEMAKFGWFKVHDGPDSKVRARSLLVRWYSDLPPDVKITGGLLRDLETRIAAQLDIERMIFRPSVDAVPPAKPTA